MEQLPPELLASIFEVLVESHLDDDVYKATYILSSVCSRWRQVVGTTPSLWSYINSTLSMQVASKALLRSGNHPLRIGFDRSDYSQDHLDEFLDLVTFHVPRWHHVSLGSLEQSDIDLLSQCDASSITYLNLDNQVDEQEMEIHGLFQGNAASLKQLRLAWMHIHLQEGFLTSMSSLVSLELTEVVLGTVEGLLLVLENSPVLEALEIYDVALRTRSWVNNIGTRFSLVNLSRLVIASTDDLIAYGVISSIAMPSLVVARIVHPGCCAGKTPPLPGTVLPLYLAALGRVLGDPASLFVRFDGSPWFATHMSPGYDDHDKTVDIGFEHMPWELITPWLQMWAKDHPSTTFGIRLEGYDSESGTVVPLLHCLDNLPRVRVLASNLGEESSDMIRFLSRPYSMEKRWPFPELRDLSLSIWDHSEKGVLLKMAQLRYGDGDCPGSARLERFQVPKWFMVTSQSLIEEIEGILGIKVLCYPSF